MSYVDQTADFGLNTLLSWQKMDQMADNDAQLWEYVSQIYFLSTNTGQSLTSGAFTKVNFGTVVSDSHSYFDTTNKRYKPLVPGYYLFTALVHVDVGSVDDKIAEIALYKNGSLLRYGEANMSRNPSLGFMVGTSGKWIAYADGVNDYFEIWEYSDAAAPATTTGGGFYFFGGAFLQGRAS